ncbi:MAG: hypothetical protein ABJB86_07935 [Bacteroidota bacterium]
MKIFLWSLLGLFLIGDALFVLPYHLSSDSVTTNYYINYKKDSLLLRNVFPDSGVQLKLNMPPGYEALYNSIDGGAGKRDSPNHLFVNISVFHNLDFMALSFPFFKVTSFNGVIPFYSIIKASNAPDMDSTVLVGNIVVNGKLSITGICSPVYARALVEKDLASILKKEMDKIQIDINRQPIKDTSIKILTPQQPAQKRMLRKRKK